MSFNLQVSSFNLGQKGVRDEFQFTSFKFQFRTDVRSFKIGIARLKNFESFELDILLKRDLNCGAVCDTI